jgi:tetrahydromethanopterin S-methyltransferase subunit G
MMPKCEFHDGMFASFEKRLDRIEDKLDKYVAKVLITAGSVSVIIAVVVALTVSFTGK